MIKKYFKLVHLIDLEGGMPQILDRLKEYEEAQPSVVKARTFSTKDLRYVGFNIYRMY